MNLPPLDARLRLIAAMVRPGRAVADVGTDHGKLIAHLVGSGQAPCGCATDIRPGPLSKARELVEQLGMQDRIRVVLCDGLAGVESTQAEEIVIAGMGGETIIHILESWPHTKEPGKHFLLQAMTRPEELRGWLWRSGFDILEERCATQGGRAYSVISASFSGRVTQPDELMLCLGAISDFDRPAEQAYGQKLLQRMEQKAAGMEKAGQNTAHLRGLMQQIKQRMTAKGD